MFRLRLSGSSLGIAGSWVLGFRDYGEGPGLEKVFIRSEIWCLGHGSEPVCC